MKKVELKSVIGLNEMIEKMKSEYEFLNYDFVREFVLENGSGVYEFMIGCRGELDDFIKNDEYMSFEECCEENSDDVDYVEEFYDDECDFVFEDDRSFKCVSFYEESYSVFVNVVV